MKAPKIIIKNYDSLLKEVKTHVEQTKASIERTLVRQKVEMAWSIGNSIFKHLKQNSQSEKNSYGKHLFASLESDTGIERTTLYRMCAFYRSYPVLPRGSDKVNWSHYQLLSGVKDKPERKYLEDLVSEKNLNVVQLRDKIKKSKTNPTSEKPSAKLTPRLGKMLHYKLFKPSGASQNYIDCGFKIYHEVPKTLSKNIKITAEPKDIYTYKGYVNRVVDGDTLRVTLDLGFGILHEEILRLRGINAIESDARGGKKATKGLEKILKNQQSIIVKTSSTDTYNRYLADIFLNDGTYINQLLLDKKLAELF